MSFAIFNENFYLRSYPDVAAAVRAGIFSSGLQHFQQQGLQEGRTEVSPYWSENSYFSFGPVFAPPKNPDVLEAVRNGVFPSGLAHFIQFGEAEGRFPEFSFYSEEYYLQRYPDVANAVSAGAIPSGYSHFIQFGQLENRIPNPFNEEYYLGLYPDVAAAVNAGNFFSGLEHYTDLGRNEGRNVLVSGTSGSDFVTALYIDGQSPDIIGVGVDVVTGGNIDIVPTSLGVGEADTLVGSGGNDTFILGVGRSSANSNPQRFYVGQGDSDFADIDFFDILGGDAIAPGLDAIQLAGRPADYVIDNSQGQARILAITNLEAIASGTAPILDLVAVVSSSNLEVSSVDAATETFILKADSNAAPPPPLF